ncbi:hypothetical protein [Hydrogenophaga sp. IBVHS2]|jgi:hypothetical protein|uniref:hypothetical protein n=1 Tax=Hydrogenophaga sp. IBVHS2 TaxID=1985170 RepID=UPI000A2EB244|nr:hypothetical protein [Hydrogenophaga sp. IBVHS2]OSZ65809.1 hypothetical protein CAP38_07115 [Hydrogenophaga sp. IBVHS2]
MSPWPTALERLQHSRVQWLRTLDQDTRSRSGGAPGALGSLFQGLGSAPWQPWLSAVSALWLAWQRHRAAPPAVATSRRRWPSAGVVGAVLITALVAALWWRSR